MFVGSSRVDYARAADRGRAWAGGAGRLVNGEWPRDVAIENKIIILVARRQAMNIPT